MRRSKPLTSVALALALVLALPVWLAPVSRSASPVRFAGVNLAGADFGETNLPGT